MILARCQVDKLLWFVFASHCFGAVLCCQWLAFCQWFVSVFLAKAFVIFAAVSCRVLFTSM